MLDLVGIGFAYAPGDWVFRDVTFGLEPGTVTSVLGPNGRGKTTLVRCAAGLLTPQEGSVRRDVPAGFVPQARGTRLRLPRPRDGRHGPGRTRRGLRRTGPA